MERNKSIKISTLIYFLIAFLITRAIVRDWEHFKVGFLAGLS